MDVNFVKPFIESTTSVFGTMVQLPVNFGKPQVTEQLPRYDISGIIGMSGDVIGSVVLSFPTESAAQIIEKFAGSKLPVDSDDFADAVGELVNMVAGAAKAKFEGKNVSISCPSVVIGKNHKVAQPSDTACVSIPCNTTMGNFCVDIAIRSNVKAGAGAGGPVKAKAA